MKSPKTQARTVADIFETMGEADARHFISTQVHMVDPRWTPGEIEQFLLSQSYGLHKDLETYADVAIERFNVRG
jgi:hypothetical protein